MSRLFQSEWALPMWGLGFLMGAALFVGVFILVRPDPFSQDSFPCHEDEVLGYVPGNFDGVECIHREDVR